MQTLDVVSASQIKDLMFGELDRELATTRRVLERVPYEHFGWKPHPKSFSLGDLATHVANLPSWGAYTFHSDGMDIASPDGGRTPVAESVEALLLAFDANVEGLHDALTGADDEGLNGEWAFRHGEQTLWAMPRSRVVRLWVLNHLIHHRAQLSVYLRLLDVPVPGIYGPSADEQ